MNIRNLILGSMTSLERFREAEKFARLADEAQRYDNLRGVPAGLADVGTAAAKALASTYDWRQYISGEEFVNRHQSILERFRVEAIVGSTAIDVFRSLSRPQFGQVELTNLLGLDSSATSEISRLINQSERVLSAVEHARKAFELSQVTAEFSSVQRAFANASRAWRLPAELIGAVGSLAALQDQIGSLTLPGIDWPSATAVARLLGESGIRSQLDALGIGEDGLLYPEGGADVEGGIGLSRKSLELMTLLGFILALLVPIYQEYASGQWQAGVDKKLDAQTSALEIQMRQLESLSHLVEKAIHAETSRVDVRFVVLGRATKVVSAPKAGASTNGTLLPREVVTLLSEDAKWVEVRYYDWSKQEYCTGWALKKYLKRVPSTYAPGLSE